MFALHKYGMIYLCPFCGTDLNTPLLDGLAACGHCSRTFDSSTHNRLLFGFWVLHRQPNIDFERFKFESKLTNDEAILVYAFVADNGYSFDELQRALKNLDLI